MALDDPRFTPDPTAGLIPVAPHYRRPRGSTLPLPDAAGLLRKPVDALLDPNTGLPLPALPKGTGRNAAGSDATAAAPRPTPKPPADWRDAALDLGVGGTSALLGFLGLPAGPVGASALAGLGGADASVLADIARAKMGTPRAPQNFKQAAGNAGLNFLGGAIPQAGGEALDLLRPGLARIMARGAFPANMPVAYEKAFGSVMPAPWEQLLEHPGFPRVGQSAEAGAKSLASSEQAKALEAANPNVYSPEDVLGRLDQEIRRMERVSSTPAADVAELKNLRQQWIAGNVPELPPPPTLYDQFGREVAIEPAPPREISGTDLPETKRFANRMAKAAIQSPESGSALRASASNTALYNKALAQEIRSRLGVDVPGLQAQDATTRYWMAAQAALKAAEKAAPRPLGAAPYALLGGLGTGVGALAGHAPQAGIGTLMALAAAEQLRNPATLSGMAQGLMTPAASAAVRMTPSALAIPAHWLAGALAPPPTLKLNPLAVDSTAVQPQVDPRFTPDPNAGLSQ